MAFDTGITLDIYFLALTLFFYRTVDSGSQYLMTDLLEIPRIRTQQKYLPIAIHEYVFIYLDQFFFM